MCVCVMCTLKPREIEECAHVPEQLVDLVMRSPEMIRLVAPRYN